MIEAAQFIQTATELGFSFYTGVPCSYLTPFINNVIASPALDYVAATSEGEAAALAFGAHLAGAKGVVMCQNSGLGNMVNPLASLHYPFRVPALLIVTWRGKPGSPDEPQHELMGRITPRLLETLDIPWAPFPQTPDDIAPALARADAYISRESRPYALIMSKGSVSPGAPPTPDRFTPTAGGLPFGCFVRTPAERASRQKTLEIIRSAIPSDAVIAATTGHTGRALFGLGDRDNQLYVVGGMGCAAAIGLGIARVRPDQPVVVLDGDGALLMKLGVLATIGHYRPPRLLHILLDNECYASTGGQSTVSTTVDFAHLAAACGYASSGRTDEVDRLAHWVPDAFGGAGPHFFHVKIGAESDRALPRPDIAPHDVRARFKRFMQTRPPKERDVHV